MRFRIALEREIAHPIERVWWALTDPDALRAWFLDNDMLPEPDRPFTLRGDPEPGWRGWTDCCVLDADPPRRLVWSFLSTDEGDPTIVTFELEPIDRGTRLTLMHEGTSDPVTVGLLGRGWPGFLVRLDDWLGERYPG